MESSDLREIESRLGESFNCLGLLPGEIMQATMNWGQGTVSLNGGYRSGSTERHM